MGTRNGRIQGNGGNYYPITKQIDYWNKQDGLTVSSTGTTKKEAILNAILSFIKQKEKK